MTVPRIKICCIASVEEAWAAINHGASAVGLVSEMPSGPGVIPEPVDRGDCRGPPPGGRVVSAHQPPGCRRDHRAAEEVPGQHGADL